MILEVIGWAMVAVSLIGTVLNIHGRSSCWWVWSIGNIGWIGVGLASGVSSIAGLNLVYLALNAWGIRQWAKRPIS